MLTPEKIEEFNQSLWAFYAENQRKLPWRNPQTNGSFDPYKILVSEIMLQQTQVERVVPYFERFITTYPDVRSLAHAELVAVYQLWQGLGYNRRARFLRDAAKQIVNDYSGIFPKNNKELTALPGVGENTAGAILAYAYNYPSIFIETNIRTVIIYSFFQGHSEKISDAQISSVLGAALDREKPREYYWALMDYGTYLKQRGVRNNARSKQYVKQSKFAGSNRQLRGKILARLLEGPVSLEELEILFKDERLVKTLTTMQREKLIDNRSGRYFIAT